LGHLFELSSTGLRQLNEPEAITQFAAVQGGRVFAVGVDEALWLYRPPVGHNFGGWQRLDGPGAVKSIDAVTDTLGRDAVFAIRGDNTFQERFNNQWLFLSGANTIQRGFSAGTDLNGNADVFGLDGINQFWRHTTSGWTPLGARNTVKTISATNLGQVVFID